MAQDYYWLSITCFESALLYAYLTIPNETLLLYMSRLALPSIFEAP